MVVSCAVALVPLLILLSLIVAAQSRAEIFPEVTGCAFILSELWILTFHSNITIRCHGLTVTNGIYQHIISWNAVEHTEINYGLWIQLVDGEPVETVHFGGSLLGELTGYRTYSKIVRRLEAARLQCQDDEPGNAEHHVRVVIPWVAILSIFAAVEALTAFGIYY